MATRTTTINGQEVTLSMPEEPMADMDLAVAEILLEMAVEGRSLELEITDETAKEIERRLARKGFKTDGSRIS
jgi:hypothetical protein